MQQNWYNEWFNVIRRIECDKNASIESLIFFLSLVMKEKKMLIMNFMSFLAW